MQVIIGKAPPPGQQAEDHVGEDETRRPGHRVHGERIQRRWLHRSTDGVTRAVGLRLNEDVPGQLIRVVLRVLERIARRRHTQRPVVDQQQNDDDDLEQGIDTVDDDERLLALAVRVALVGRFKPVVTKSAGQ